MGSLVAGSLLYFVRLFAGAGFGLEAGLKKAAGVLERTSAYRFLLWAISLADGLGWKRSVFRGDFFAPWNLLSAYSLLYLLLAYSSFIPILSYSTWFVSAALFLFGISLVVSSAWLVSRLRLGCDAFDFKAVGSGLLAIGTGAVLANYLLVGLPLLDPSMRTAFHNGPYQAFFVFFVLGLALTAAGLRKVSEVFVLAAFGGALSFFSGFRTDFILAVAPVLLTAVYTGVLGVRRLFMLLFALFSSALVLKVVLLLSGGGGAGLFNLVSGRAGFTFYVLGSVYEVCGLSGCGGGVLILNSFLQFFAHRVLVGGFGAEFSSWLPRFFTSGFVGPLLLDAGIFGIVVGSVFVGAVLGALYSLRKNVFFAALYSVSLWYSFIWVETGPIQAYFLALHLLFVLLVLRLARR